LLLSWLAAAENSSAAKRSERSSASPTRRTSLRESILGLTDARIALPADPAGAENGEMAEARLAGEGLPKRWSAATAHPDMWVNPKEDTRDSGVPITNERANLIEYLRAYRLTLEMKCAGLTPEQMAMRSVPPSDMSLLGLVRHLANVERGWFRKVMAGEDAPHHFSSKEDWGDSWLGAVGDEAVVAEAWAAWRREVANSERFVEQAQDLDLLARSEDNPQLQLREVLVHMIEEYARHCGHADLLRERIDGRVGQ
jgi:uncharacterized damage-inducible protein DinB